MNILSITNAILGIERRRLYEEGTFRSCAYHLLFCVQGSLSVSGGFALQASPLAAFFANGSVTLTPENHAEYLLLLLDPEYVLSLTGRRELFRTPLSFFPAETAALTISVLLKMEQLSGKEGTEHELERAAGVLALLSYITELIPEGEKEQKPIIPLTKKREALYLSLVRLIEDHADRPLSLTEAAAKVQITPQYLGSFLKEASGLTYRQAVLAARKRKSDLFAAFSRQGRMPEEPPGMRLTTTSAAGPGQIHPARKEILLNARIDPVHPLPQYFRTLVNLGYAANLRSLDIDRALEFVQSQIGFRYGRICRITDLITTGSIMGRSFYDFSAVFSLLDVLIARGITPFLELGNKSFLIQETTSLSYTPVSPTDSKEYYQSLLKILPEFARACINHFGQTCFDSWYFEISFMYTSDEERAHFGLVQYAGMFRKIHQVLRSFSGSCKIGGPGFNDWSDPAKVRQMIRLISSHGVTPDFFSAYIYPMKSDEGGTMRLSEDPDEGIRRMQSFVQTVNAEHPGKEVWVTEFNSNLSSRNYLNDAPYQAAYITRIAMAAMPLGLMAIGYYLLSDAPLRYLDSLDFLFGGWGLLSDRGLPKPSFYAYRMMQKLGHYLIRQSGNCLITANSKGSIQILLYRYQHPLGKYLLDNVEKEDLLLPETVFENNGFDRYRISIRGVLKGTYLVKEYRVNSSRGNLYSSWRELEFLYPPNEATLRELQLRSSLCPDMHILKLREGQPFTADLELGGTELCLVTVDLQASHS